MRIFLPRARRILCELAIEVSLVDSGTGQQTAGPVAAALCNISESGCCIELESPLVQGHHLFFATLNSTTRHLLLAGALPASQEQTFTIAATSVWMNAADEERPPGFRIGLHFFERQHQLFRAICRL